MRMGLAFFTILGALSMWSGAIAGTFPDTPDTLICSLPPAADQPGYKVVLYLQAVTDDGHRYYKSLGIPGVTAIASKDGVVDSSLHDCNGKTLSELSQKGQAVSF